MGIQLGSTLFVEMFENVSWGNCFLQKCVRVLGMFGYLGSEVLLFKFVIY